MAQTSMNNGSITATHDNIMLAFQERAQQITREHVDMLQLIYRKDHSNIERRKMLFEQHYMFLKEELADLLKQVIKTHNHNAGTSTDYVKDKLRETQERYLNFFRDNCNPKRSSDQD